MPLEAVALAGGVDDSPSMTKTEILLIIEASSGGASG